MLREVIEKKYQTWNNARGDQTIGDFIASMTADCTMTADDVIWVLNRSSVISSDDKLSISASITAILEEAAIAQAAKDEAARVEAFRVEAISLLKSEYTRWLKAPVAHTAEAFITSAASTFNITPEEVRGLLDGQSWFRI